MAVSHQALPDQSVNATRTRSSSVSSGKPLAVLQRNDSSRPGGPLQLTYQGYSASLTLNKDKLEANKKLMVMGENHGTYPTMLDVMRGLDSDQFIHERFKTSKVLTDPIFVGGVRASSQNRLSEDKLKTQADDSLHAGEDALPFALFGSEHFLKKRTSTPELNETLAFKQKRQFLTSYHTALAYLDRQQTDKRKEKIAEIAKMTAADVAKEIKKPNSLLRKLAGGKDLNQNDLLAALTSMDDGLYDQQLSQYRVETIERLRQLPDSEFQALIKKNNSTLTTRLQSFIASAKAIKDDVLKVYQTKNGIDMTAPDKDYIYQAFHKNQYLLKQWIKLKADPSKQFLTSRERIEMEIVNPSKDLDNYVQQQMQTAETLGLRLRDQVMVANIEQALNAPEKVKLMGYGDAHIANIMHVQGQIENGDKIEWHPRMTDFLDAYAH